MPEREEVCIRRLLSRRVNGLFISPVYRFGSRGANLSGSAGAPNPDGFNRSARAILQMFVSVEIDEQAASHAATQHLLKLATNALRISPARTRTVGA